MNESQAPDLYEVAARAAINERCAGAYLHDVRGSMQALFSALELLGRSAMSGGANLARVEKACDLARRAITHHEKSTMGVLQLLTLQPSVASTVNLGDLVHDVAHFLRNDAMTKGIDIEIASTAEIFITAERSRLQTLLVGLMTAALDATPSGQALQISVEQWLHDAMITMASAVDEHVLLANNPDLLLQPHTGLLAQQLTLQFARSFLEANGGRLEIVSGLPSGGALRLFYPCAESSVRCQ